MPSPDEWNRHKDAILSLLRDMTLKDAMVQMDRRGFCAK